MNLEKQLLEGLEAINHDISDRKALCTRLLQYTALIEKWNQVHNITAVRKPEEMVSKHLLDSLTLLPHIIGQYVADVGVRDYRVFHSRSLIQISASRLSKVIKKRLLF